jgi:hypothetical protein
MLEILYVTVYALTTTIGWSDGTTTVAQMEKNDLFDIEKGVLYAISKKFVETTDILRAIESAKYSLANSQEGQKKTAVSTGVKSANIKAG